MRWTSLLTIYWIRTIGSFWRALAKHLQSRSGWIESRDNSCFFVLFLHYCNRNNNNKRSTKTVWNRAEGWMMLKVLKACIFVQKHKIPLWGASGWKQGRWAMRAVSHWALSLFDAAAWCQVFLERNIRNHLEIICYAKTQEALRSSDRLSGCPPCHISHSLLISPNHRTTWPVLEGLLTSAISVGQICTVACYEGKNENDTLMIFDVVCICLRLRMALCGWRQCGILVRRSS